MRNEHYAQDLRALLENTKSNHAYLVTGFLIAVGANWTIEAESNQTDAVEVNVPLSALTTVPVLGLLDFSFKPKIRSAAQQRRQMSTAEEDIFAVSYSAVKLSHRFSLSTSFISKTPVLGPPKRAKAYHLALGDDDDSSEEVDWDSDDEDAIFGVHNQIRQESMIQLVADDSWMEEEKISHPVARNLYFDL